MNVKKNYIVFVAALQALFFSTAHAQEEAVLIDKYERQFGYLDSLFFIPAGKKLPYKEESPEKAHGTAWEIMSEEYACVERALHEKELAEISLVRSATGLRFSGDTYRRFNSGDRTVRDEDGASSGYDMKYQAGINWSPLQSGLFRRGSKTREIFLEKQIASSASRSSLLQGLVRSMKEKVEYKYASLLRGVLLLHLSNLSLLEETGSLLVSEGRSSSDKMFGILEDKAEIGRSLSLIPSGTLPVLDFREAGKGAVLEVDTAGLFACFRRTNAELCGLSFRDSLLALKARCTDYWEEIDISPYIRYSAYTRKTGTQPSNLDAGLSVRIPLSAESGRKRRVLEAERRLLGFEQERVLRTGEQEIQRLLERLESLNRSVRLERERLSAYIGLLAQRRNAYGEMCGEYSRPDRIKEYNACLSVLETLLSLRRERELLVADLQGFLPETPISEFVREKETENDNEPYYKNKR